MFGGGCILMYIKDVPTCSPVEKRGGGGLSSLLQATHECA